jgi:hypothetical protein
MSGVILPSGGAFVDFRTNDSYYTSDVQLNGWTYMEQTSGNPNLVSGSGITRIGFYVPLDVGLSGTILTSG